MPFTITPVTITLSSTYPYWLTLVGSDHIEDHETVATLTELFGPSGGKFPNLEACWGHKELFGEKVLMFRTLEDRTLARLRITC